MPKRTTLTERFRRVSTNEIFRRSSKAEAPQEPLPEEDKEWPVPIRSKTIPEPSPSQSAQSSLLALPTEIHAEILSYTDYDSLCAFRLASRTTHYLLSSGDIVRSWINFHVDDHRLFLHPPPSPPTFKYVLEQQRRELTVTQTVYVLVEYIEHEILRHTLRRARIEVDMYRQGLFGLVKIRLREKLAPLLYTIQRYLELKATELLTQNETDHTKPSTAELSFLRSLPSAHLLLAHKCSHFLTWLSTTILARPSYVGGLERTMRGWLSEPLDLTNFRLHFLFGSVGTLKDLLELGSYKHRRKAVEAWMRGLSPGENVFWRERWGKVGALGLGTEGQLGRERVDSALSVELGVEDVWVRGARRVLLEDGILKEGEEKDVGSPWQTMDFLCDLAGYDILHTPPSWANPGSM